MLDLGVSFAKTMAPFLNERPDEIDRKTAFINVPRFRAIYDCRKNIESINESVSKVG